MAHYYGFFDVDKLGGKNSGKKISHTINSLLSEEDCLLNCRGFGSSVWAMKTLPSNKYRAIIYRGLPHRAVPHPWCESILGLKVEAVQGKQVSLEWTETSGGPWKWWHDPGVPLAFPVENASS